MQVGIGMMPGANGMQVGPVIMPGGSTESKPSEYKSYFETPEGVRVDVIAHTDNNATADRFEDELAQRMGWKVVEAPETNGPKGIGEKLLEAWLVAVVVPFMLGLCGMLILITANIADLVSFREMQYLASSMTRVLMISVPVIGLALSGVALFTHSSKEKHV